MIELRLETNLIDVFEKQKVKESFTQLENKDGDCERKVQQWKINLFSLQVLTM